jgi:hypothetical protein
MKIKKILYFAIILIVLTSCSSAYYYQVYKAFPSQNISLKDNFLVYEDENSTVSYFLWDRNGDIGFRFYNKTDSNIYLNLEESFFVVNGTAHNYYRNRIYTNSTSSGSSSFYGGTVSKSVTGLNYSDLVQTNKISATNSVGFVTSSGYSVAYYEERTVCIPAKTSKIISEYTINELIIRDCDLLLYPSKKQVKSKTFDKSESPLTFSNRIAYSRGHNDTLIRFENEFYVSQITNYPESAMIESKYDEYCGQKSNTPRKYFKNVTPDKFYVKYTKREDGWKH